MKAVNFDTKHLRKGDALPPWNGKLRAYNMRLCPFAQRTILALNAKQIDYEVINIDLADKPEWLHSKSAFGKVPAIEIEEEVTIYESIATVEYIDEVYPQRPLLPSDPVKKAFDKIIVEASEPIRSVYFKLMRAPETINEDSLVAYYKAINFLEEQLKSRGSTFFDGDEPGYADYMMWPWFERLMIIDDPRFKIEATKYGLLADCLQKMLKDPAVSQYLLPKEIFDIFHREYKTGTFRVQLIEN